MSQEQLQEQPQTQAPEQTPQEQSQPILLFALTRDEAIAIHNQLGDLPAKQTEHLRAKLAYQSREEEQKSLMEQIAAFMDQQSNAAAQPAIDAGAPTPESVFARRSKKAKAVLA